MRESYVSPDVTVCIMPSNINLTVSPAAMVMVTLMVETFQPMLCTLGGAVQMVVVGMVKFMVWVVFIMGIVVFIARVGVMGWVVRSEEGRVVKVCRSR